MYQQGRSAHDLLQRCLRPGPGTGLAMSLVCLAAVVTVPAVADTATTAEISPPTQAARQTSAQTSVRTSGGTPASKPAQTPIQSPAESSATAKEAAALAALRARAREGDAGAQTRLGLRYLGGHGVPQDVGRGMVWLRKAAEAGHAPAQFVVGVMVLGGQYPGAQGPDPARAADWLTRAAKQDCPGAAGVLSGMYLAGAPGLARDTAQGMQWLRRAAEGGDVLSQAMLANSYREGRDGLVRNPVEAYAWLDVALSGKALAPMVSSLAPMRQQLVQGMDAAQRAQAEARARDYRSRYGRHGQGLCGQSAPG